MSQQALSEVRRKLEGVNVLSYPPNKDKDVLRLYNWVHELSQEIGRSHGLAIGSQRYEELVDDPRLNVRKLENEVYLTPEQARKLQRIEDSIATLKREGVRFSGD